MIMLIQRVDTASVSINNKMYNKINKGLLIFVGIHKNDTINDVDYLIKKSTQLRIFNDKNNKMNLSIKDIKGEILLISQFTLIANTNKGLRPSFIDASKPEKAKKLYNILVEKMNALDLLVKSGQFGSDMQVQLNNIGPATFILDSNN